MKTHFYKDEIKNICCDKHLDVDTIFEEVKKNNPKVGKSTIYRNVEEMVVSGDLKKITGIGTKTLYETIKHQHAHFYDEKTGKVYDIEVGDFDIDLPKGFEVSSLDIRIYGKKSS